MKQFTIRVYGILYNEYNQVLISDELVKGIRLTKFPGGGLEYGEGTKDCVVREYMEEMNLHIKVLSHYYTTDFYQESAFNPSSQIISIYYKVQALEPLKVLTSNVPYNFTKQQLAAYNTSQQIEAFRWLSIPQATTNDVTFAIDKVVLQMLINNL